jgi:TRAP-type C4-dicarboxylate transport system permease small subunit
MDAFVALLPPKLRSIVELLGEIVLMATSLLIAILAWPVVSMLAELDQRSQAANIPLVLPQAMMPIGFLLMALLIAVRLISRGTSDDHAQSKISDH